LFNIFNKAKKEQSELKTKFKYIFYYFLYWYLYFVIARLIFIVYQHKLCIGLNLGDILLTFFHGAKLDISVTGYIVFFPLLLVLLSSFINQKLLFIIIKAYSLILLIFIGFIILADMELYTYWGFRIDTTPLLYIKDKEAITASLTIWQLIKLILLLACWLIFSIYIYLKIFEKFKNKLIRDKYSLFFILFFPILFIAVRGGTGIAPLNTGSAYFHSNQFLNHTAINPIWNAIYSITEVTNSNENYPFFDQKEAVAIVKELNITVSSQKELLKCRRPNIILIMLESFTTKAIEPLGGLKDITPNLNNLIEEGILFDHFYANGDRTDKALVAVLGSYPPLPKTQIIKYPSKSDKLDYIPKTLKENGYATAFYYGGEVEFANYNSILVSAMFDKIISLKDFDAAQPRSKWGVYDHVTFNYLLDHIPNNNTRFFFAMLTLSSHEPFSIPGTPLLQGNSSEIKYLNSVNYTDKCIGDFIAKAKKAKWWDSTLIIFVADHGSAMPGYSSIQDPVKYHIPMIWIGGALNVRDTVIHTYGSQQDIARTLLEQLKIKSDGFTFSHNILSASTNHFAFFTFNNGFGYLTNSSTLVYDNSAGKYLISKGKVSEFDKKAGKAFLQILCDDFLKK
jgi:phosphoglycerol transferase MdoB-like AlkP superfamily enzyme